MKPNSSNSTNIVSEDFGKLRSIITAGQQENYKLLVEQILESGGERSEALEEMKRIMDFLSYDRRRKMWEVVLVQSKKEKRWAQKILPHFIKLWIIEQDQVDLLVNELFDEKSIHSFEVRYMLPALVNASSIPEIDKERLVQKYFPSIADDFPTSALAVKENLPAFLGTWYVKDKDTLEKLFSTIIRKPALEPNDVILFIKVLETGYISEELAQEGISKILPSIINIQGEDIDSYDLLSGLLKTWLVSQGQTMSLFYEFIDYIEAHISQGISNVSVHKKLKYGIGALLGTDIIEDLGVQEAMKDIYPFILDRILKDSNWVEDIWPIFFKRLIEAWIMSPTEIQSLFSKQILTHKIHNWETLALISTLLNTGIINSVEWIDDFLEKLIEDFKQDTEYSKEVFIELVRVWFIKQGQLEKFFIEFLDEAKECATWAKEIVSMLLYNKLIDITNIKEELKQFLYFILNKEMNNEYSSRDSWIHWVVLILDLGIIKDTDKRKIIEELFFISSKRIKWDWVWVNALSQFLENSGIEKMTLDNSLQENINENFSKNTELYDKIFLYLDNDLNAIRYLEENFLNTSKLQELHNFFIPYHNPVNAWHSPVNTKFFSSHIVDICNDEKWIEFWYFITCINQEVGLHEDYSINYQNFLDYLDDDEVFIVFEKDQWFSSEWTIPWTKAWFLEKSGRKNYLSPSNIKTFKKFGTIIWLGIIEWTNSPDELKWFYEHIFSQIDIEKSRSSILQLWEVFNLLLKDEKYDIFDELVNNQVNIWDAFKEFIEDHNISDKWRTILTLMIASEINRSFQIFSNWEVENKDVKTMLLKVFEKLKRYKSVIDRYKNAPIKTSIGLEYEVTQSIARGYRQLTKSDYKNDIEILSEYSWIAEGNDAVHEIATKPTNNPYLLILEMKLLQDLDFVDLNFTKQDYERWARGIHVTVSWEDGIRLEAATNFIQNILIWWNIWGVNSWEQISVLNPHGNIRQKEDLDKIFGMQYSHIWVEYRSFNIDKAELLERLILSVFNLNMANQSIMKRSILVGYVMEEADGSLWQLSWFRDEDALRIWELMLKAFKLLFDDIEELILDHNHNFLENEAERSFEDMINDNMDENARKRQNMSRFKSVVLNDWGLGNYISDIHIDDRRFMNWQIQVDIVNKFIKLNNLFTKKDSTNALSMLYTTREPDGELMISREHAETTVFDKLDRWLEEREGYNVIQWASEKMLTQAIQKRILKFNKDMRWFLES